MSELESRNVPVSEIDDFATSTIQAKLHCGLPIPPELEDVARSLLPSFDQFYKVAHPFTKHVLIAEKTIDAAERAVRVAESRKLLIRQQAAEAEERLRILGPGEAVKLDRNDFFKWLRLNFSKPDEPIAPPPTVTAQQEQPAVRTLPAPRTLKEAAAIMSPSDYEQFVSSPAGHAAMQNEGLF